MAKTTRRAKAMTNAKLTNIPVESTATPPQPLPRKCKSRQPKEGPAATPAAILINNALASPSRALPRSGSKQALILGLLSRQQGACLAEMMEATGWLPHTTRAALTGLRQRGCTIERSTGEDGCSTYRVTNATPTAADGEKA